MLTFALVVSTAGCAFDVHGQQDAIDEPFHAGGTVAMQLDSGNYAIRASSGDRVHVVFSGNIGSANGKFTASGDTATLSVSDTAHNHFDARIEVPQATNLRIRLNGGNLTVAAIDGDKSIKSNAGNIEVDVPNSNEYGDVDASVMAGNIEAPAFGGSAAGLFRHFKWSGRGAHSLRVTLGAGNLELH